MREGYMIGAIMYKGCWKNQDFMVIINKEEMVKVSVWLNVKEEFECWGCEPGEKRTDGSWES